MAYVTVGSRAKGIFGDVERGDGGHYMARRGARRGMGSLLDDIVNAGQDAINSGVKKGQSDLEGKVGDIANQVIRSSQFKVVLDAVEAKAQSGVKKVIAQNGVGLIGLCIGAGSIGGIFGKGKIGAGASVALTAASLIFLISVNQPAK